MLLYSVNERSIPLLLGIACALRLRCRTEVTLLAVFIEFHTSLKEKLNLARRRHLHRK